MAHKHSVSDNGDLRKYYAAIPNIVFTLGLHPYELTLYVYLKKVAGEDQVCWQSTATIAKACSMSAGMVSKLKAALARERVELGGKALITITTEMQNGGNANHGITITDIWPENMAELERVRRVKATRSQSEVAPSPYERARSPHEPARSQSEGTRSCGDDKEDLKKNNQEETKKEISAHALLMDFHNNHLAGPMPDGQAQGAALKWLLQHYSRDTLIACYESQLTERWRAKVNWMTVKSDIGQWITRNGNNNGSSKSCSGQSHSGSTFEYKPKSKVC